jgi:hypothetical protein
MSYPKLMVIVTLFLIMKDTLEQMPPDDCFCQLAADPAADHCYSRGCSVGNNNACHNRSVHFANGFYVMVDFDQDYPGFVGRLGCNCPNTTATIFHNGYFFHGPYFGYRYTTCTDFGGHARDVNNTRPGGANAATDCCNYCCDRHDPHPHPIKTTTTKSTKTTKTTTTTTHGDAN